jgi:thiamine biosynthesis lipoprotein
VNFGNSSVLCLGHHPYGDSWCVSIENPYLTEDILGSIQISNKSLSTSGNMPTHTSHIINPISQEYIEKHQIVSVVSSNAVEAEILSTTLMIANDKEKVEILSRFQLNDIYIYNIGEKTHEYG